MSLDSSQLHRNSLWTWRIQDGHLEAREAGCDWTPVGLASDVRALHEFYGAPYPGRHIWTPWTAVRDWYLKRRAKRIYAHWYETKHKAELEQKKRKRLSELNQMIVRKAP